MWLETGRVRGSTCGWRLAGLGFFTMFLPVNETMGQADYFVMVALLVLPIFVV